MRGGRNELFPEGKKIWFILWLLTRVAIRQDEYDVHCTADHAQLKGEEGPESVSGNIPVPKQTHTQVKMTIRTLSRLVLFLPLVSFASSRQVASIYFPTG